MFQIKWSFLLIAACLVAAALADTKSGPFCWSGKDDNGKDQFVPCGPKKQRSLLNLNLDLKNFEGLRICVEQQCATVSRERFLGALADWRAENRAKP